MLKRFMALIAALALLLGCAAAETALEPAVSEYAVLQKKLSRLPFRAGKEMAGGFSPVFPGRRE